VAWEEVGLCWFKVTVHGTFNYVGSRHRLPTTRPSPACRHRHVSGGEACGWRRTRRAVRRGGRVGAASTPPLGRRPNTSVIREASALTPVSTS
jgi:hypothetical protein